MKRVQAIRPGDFASEKRVRRSAFGFTLVELLVVIAIIGVLVALLLPAVQAAREAARRTKCLNNMKQNATGFQLYHDANKVFPGAQAPYDAGLGAAVYNLNHGYVARLLPYIEQGNLYDQYNFNIKWNAGTNAAITTTELGNLDIQLCPSSEHEQDAYGDYAALVGPGRYNVDGRRYADAWNANYKPGGYSPGGSYALGAVLALWGDPTKNGSHPNYTADNTAVSIKMITDGTSQTLVLGEAAGRTDGNFRWGDGSNAFAQHYELFQDINLRGNEMWSDHPGGVHVTFADSSAHFLSESTAKWVLDCLATRATGEILDAEDY